MAGVYRAVGNARRGASYIVRREEKRRRSIERRRNRFSIGVDGGRHTC
jgi:hypothetical protein